MGESEVGKGLGGGEREEGRTLFERGRGLSPFSQSLAAQ
jgi:hypothetical protein